MIDIHSVQKELNENIEKLSRSNGEDLNYLRRLNKLVRAYIENKNTAPTDQSKSCI